MAQIKPEVKKDGPEEVAVIADFKEGSEEKKDPVVRVPIIQQYTPPPVYITEVAAPDPVRCQYPGSPSTEYA